jgi:hypothetical protein
VEAAETPGPQNLQKDTLLDVAHTSLSKRSRKVAKRRPSIWISRDAGMIREREVNTILRRGKRQTGPTGRGRELLDGDKTEKEDMLCKPAESEDLLFKGKRKKDDSRVKFGGEGEKKTFGGRHGAGTGKHCAGANTTGVWIALARGLLAELCVESTLAPELNTMSAF